MSKRRPTELGSRTKIRILKKLILENNGICHWCGCQTNDIPNHSKKASIDHLISVLEGRTTPREGGFVLACRSCNHGRSSKFQKEMNRQKQNIYFQTYSLFGVNLDFSWVPAIIHEPYKGPIK
jgi:hypothetical protein